MRHELEIVIGADGEITIKVKGASGEECLELTKDLEAALGLVTAREKTSEFYQAEVTADETVRIGDD